MQKIATHYSTAFYEKIVDIGVLSRKRSNAISYVKAYHTTLILCSRIIYVLIVLNVH